MNRRGYTIKYASICSLQHIVSNNRYMIFTISPKILQIHTSEYSHISINFANDQDAICSHVTMDDKDKEGIPII